MAQKIFLLGVGCQKGGTTWLWYQLRKHHSVNLGFSKEYHVLEAWAKPEKFNLERHKKRLGKALSTRNGNTKGNINNLLIKHSFYRDIANYYGYFQQLSLESDVTRVVGDITPAYCCLPVDFLKETKQHLQAKGFNVKIVFLMREPFERIWSQVRMHRHKAGAQSASADSGQSEQDAVLSQYKCDAVEFRTRYEQTVANYEAVFSPDAIFYSFYENLFTHGTINRLTDFLGITPLAANFDLKPNASPKAEKLDENAIREIVGFYRDTYAFCDARFKASEYWRGYKYL